MQPLVDDMRVLCIGPDLLDGYWPHTVRLLAEGMRAADLDPAETVDAILQHQLLLWVVTTDDMNGICAVFLTALGWHEGRRVVEIGGLAGRGPRNWAGALSRRMAEYARDEQCGAYRFCGAEGWARLLPECRAIGRHSSGATIYEGAAA